MAITCPKSGPGLAKYFTVVGNECVPHTSFFKGKPVLDLGVGYGIVLGFGLAFALLTTFLVWLNHKYMKTKQTSESFSTAGRDVKTGLIASVIVSRWTWAATLLQSSNVAWKFGVSGPFWYASGATIQVLLFGVLAIEIKRKAPTAHTIGEIIKARWGTATHVVFLFFLFLTNMIVTAMLLLGGSAVVSALTGMNIYVASFLIPLGIIIYTVAGGLKATFLACFLDSLIIHVILLLFIFLVYASAPELGSPGIVYEKLQALVHKTPEECKYAIANKQACGPIAGNRGGSYATMLSTNGFVFGIINIIGNFGTVFVDQGYWASAIAARPSSSHKGYLLGGLVWFCVPFSLGTSLGLASLALNLPITATEAGAGLVPPAAAVALLGKPGAALIILMLFMAVTSSGAAELLAVSNLVTYDIYRPYINPKASGKQMLFVSRSVALCFGLFMGVLAVVLNLAGVSLGWMYLAMGVFIGSAVIPVALCLLWKQANAIGAIAGCVVGSVTAVITWLAHTQIQYGRITLDTTGRDATMLSGNIVAILVGGLVHLFFTLAKPQNYDWESMRQIAMVENDVADLPESEYEPERLNHSKWWIIKYGVGFTLLIVVIWPAASLGAGEFSKGFFYFWAIISIIWGTVASAFIIFMPLIESADGIIGITKSILTGSILKNDPVIPATTAADVPVVKV